MLLTFLTASDGTRLSKRFTLSDGELQIDSYPLVREVTSIEMHADTPAQIHEAISVAAESGLCLLKGNPMRPIENESRAGLMLPQAKTEWLVLDLDFESAFADHDAFLDAIGCGGVSYVKQISASAGVTRPAGLRAHLFLQLATPAAPALLKEWVRAINLNTPALRDQMHLTASKRALHWPLDPLVNDNTRLLYIAPPEFEGMDDPITDRITYHERSAERLALDLSAVDAARNQAAAETHVNALRTDLGLPKSQGKYKTLHDGTELLLNPASAIVTGVKEARGFVYLNLNGGDSWGYYYNPTEPTYLHNFKGEPSCRLQDIAPDYWRQIIKPSPQLDVAKPGTERFVLRDNTTDTYYTAIWRPDENYVELNKAQRKNLVDFLAVTNEPMPDTVPEWTIEFDPTSTTVYDPLAKKINLYRPTEYLLKTFDAPACIPPVIDRIITSICVDDATKGHFLNWLAYVFQTRKKPKTAFLHSGKEGTGKGLFFSKILAPLFGQHHCLLTTVSAIKDDFNSWAGNKLFLCIDEFKVETKDEEKVPELLRYYITEDWLDARAMRTERKQIRNYLCVVIFTNMPAPMRIPTSDRRYNVAPRQEQRLIITDEEIESIKDELPSFANFLKQYPASEAQAHRALDNDAKDAMRVSAEGTGERILRAISEGDLQFFIDLVDLRPPAMPDPQSARYTTIVHEWVNARPDITLTLDDLRTVYQHLSGGIISKIRLLRNVNNHLPWPHHASSIPMHFNTDVALPDLFTKPPETKAVA